MSENCRENQDLERNKRSSGSGVEDTEGTREDFCPEDSEKSVPVGSEKDLLDAMMRDRDIVIRETFGEDADPEEHKLSDCFAEYKKRADQKKRPAHHELAQFKMAIEHWASEIESVQTRMREKSRFRAALERYAEERHGMVLFNLNYWYYQMASYIDAALILPNAVILLNLRVPNHDSIVDEDGNLCWLDPYTAKLEKENIRNELYKQELMVRMMLSSAHLERPRVLTSLIVGGDEFQFVNHDADNVTSGRLASLEKSITLESSECFTKIERTIVTKKLWEQKVNSEKGAPSYHSNLLEAYRALQERLQEEPEQRKGDTNMEIICDHCGKELGKVIGGGLSIERMGEDGVFNFRLCTDCTQEFIGLVDAFVEPCKLNHKVEGPHKIVNEEVLLKEATRQDVRDFLIEHGLDEEMAFAISEEVRKGHFSSGRIRQDMMDALGKGDVPEWFVEGCKKVIYLSDRKNYSTPSLVDDEESEEDWPELKQLIKLEITECE